MEQLVSELDHGEAGTEDHSRIQLRNCQLWVWVLTSL